MFNWLFNKKTKSSGTLSKVDYWKKWELFELFDSLFEGEKLLLDLSNKNADTEFLKFKEDYIEELYEIEGDNVADFTRMWEWFSPAKEWDILTGEKGRQIRENVFRITDKWKRNQDFLIGTKVSLENEFGVVLNNSEEGNRYGLIRWDTNKEDNTEDWRGLFGSFLKAGGQVISQDYEFKFINDDGTAKRN